MTLFSFFTLLTLLNLIRLIFSESYLWQRKEYRIDRMISFFYTKEGILFLMHPLIFLKWVLFFGGIPLFFSSPTDFFFLGIAIISADLMMGMHKLRRPKVTFRSGALAILSVLILLGLYDYVHLPLTVFLVLADRFIFVSITLSVFLTSIPSFLYIKYQAFKARKKIESYPNLTVIGITGSYGKTTTKEFLSTILSQKYRVVKTEGTNNTEIGIAKTVLKKLTPDTQVLIAEMGAYKNGEIKTLCDMVHPTVGILTGINSEHVELFGSLENILKAKYELVQGLAGNGMVFLNQCNQQLREIIPWVERDRTDLRVFCYGEAVSQKAKNNLEIRKINSKLEFLTFDICWKGTCLGCKTTFGGEQFIQNIWGASSVALALGLSLIEVQKGITNLSLLNNRMKLIRLGKVCIIDDTYNSNPDGVLSGLRYLSQFHGEKWLVFTPIIELSKEGKQIHRGISKEAQNICDSIFLTNPNYSEEFLGLRKDRIFILNKAKELDSYPFDKSKDLMIYFSGREARKQMELIIRKLK